MIRWIASPAQRTVTVTYFRKPRQGVGDDHYRKLVGAMMLAVYEPRLQPAPDRIAGRR